MPRNNSFLETLLHEDEGSTLDFKREQYPCRTEEERGELIKDILAFTNAWRHADAFILIGVDENPGGRAKVVGVAHHLKDANLQQLVNSKTDQPVAFSYRADRLDGKDIGILHIPVQGRPRFMKKKFGKLAADTVYLRRGSSTAIARPDEVAKMGVAISQQPSPQLQIQFANPENRELNGETLELYGTCIEVSDVEAIPDFMSQRQTTLFMDRPNREYYRELAMYKCAQLLCRPLRFAITNFGSVPATDVRAELNLELHEAVVFDDHNWPNKPEQHLGMSAVSAASFRRFRGDDDIVVEELGNKKKIIMINIDKVQPKQTAWIDASLYLGIRSSGIISLGGAIWSDNLPSPQSIELKIRFTTKSVTMTWRQLLESA
ncbi:MAG: ATP-binding protein [Acidobacteriia bacterium]|nr:ATP-binding protein [Terriglobia bacterium]